MGMLDGISGLFGGTGDVALANAMPGDALDNLFKLLPNAKGNIFDNSPSLHQYANTVQTSPRYFETHAKGNIFAEAGPEAVMPLARDSVGRLGVRVQDGQGGAKQLPTINVNLYGNNNNAPDVRRAAGQGAREALAAYRGAQRYA